MFWIGCSFLPRFVCITKTTILLRSQFRVVLPNDIILNKSNQFSFPCTTRNRVNSVNCCVIVLHRRTHSLFNVPAQALFANGFCVWDTIIAFSETSTYGGIFSYQSFDFSVSCQVKLWPFASTVKIIFSSLCLAKVYPSDS